MYAIGFKSDNFACPLPALGIATPQICTAQSWDKHRSSTISFDERSVKCNTSWISNVNSWV